jgi:hypothetical protein
LAIEKSRPKSRSNLNVIARTGDDIGVPVVGKVPKISGCATVPDFDGHDCPEKMEFGLRLRPVLRFVVVSMSALSGFGIQ